MKRLALIVFLCRLSGQGWVEGQAYLDSRAGTQRVNGFFVKPVSKEWGSFVWFQVQQSYSQAYAGVTYSPKPWLQLALGTGIEQDKNPLRIGSYLYVSKKNLSGLAVFETGGSGFWYKIETNYQIKRFFGVGILSDHYRGHGPKFEILIPCSRLTLWAAPLVVHNSVSPVLGLRWTL